LRFLNEALDATLVHSDFAGEEFQSHRPAEFGILGAVDFSHSSRTYLADDAILGQRNSGRKFSHCCFLRDWPDCRKQNSGAWTIGFSEDRATHNSWRSVAMNDLTTREPATIPRIWSDCW
jgi:hypothetical protein